MPTIQPDASYIAPTPLGVGVSGLFVLLVAAAAWHDVRHRRIPNLLNAILLLAGVVASVAAPVRVVGAVDALAGVGVGLALWLPFYVLGFLGAGDVKFFAASSAWLGVSLSWRAALLSALLGGVVAVVFLLRESRLGRVARSLALVPFLRRLPAVSIEGMSEAEARRQLPYGVPMAVGAAVAFLSPRLVGG